MTDPRPSLDAPLDRLLARLVRDIDAFSGLDPRAILIVAQGAYGTAAASVRALDGCAETVSVGGHARSVEIALRPPFFHRGDPARRVTTLIHELLHLDPTRPGTLHPARRHRVRDHDAHEADARALARAFIAGLSDDVTLLAPLGHEGEARLRAWRHRPVPETHGRRFSGRDLYASVVTVHTPRARRAVWW